MNNTPEKVSIIIPNYNGASYIRDCLNSVLAMDADSPEIIVVDNGSEDESDKIVETEYPSVRLIRLPSNTGFCGGVNTGIRAAKDASFIVLLNVDTRVDHDFLKTLLREMKKDPRTFSCQARMLSMKDPTVLDGAGDLYCALGWAFARGKGKKDSEHFQKPCRIFSSCAGAAVYRTSVFEKIGIFDENHFAYLEDTDIGWRAQIFGYRNRYVPDAVVYHVGSAASGSIYNLFKVRNTSRNSVYLIYKNMPVVQFIVNLPFLIPGFIVKALFFTVKGFGREYLTGLKKGFILTAKGKKEGKKIKFSIKYLRNYLYIELQILVNVFRRLAGFFYR